MKIKEITYKDYTHNGLGFNYANLVNNVLPRFSKWCLLEFSNHNRSYEETVALANKLQRIIDIINE